MTPQTPREQPEILSRLERLEESHAFAERTVEQLSTEMAEINRRLGEMAARLARLEGRVRESEERKSQGEGKGDGEE